MTTNAYKEVKGKLDGLEDLRSGTAQPRWNGEQANLERKERNWKTRRSYVWIKLSSCKTDYPLLQLLEQIKLDTNDKQPLAELVSRLGSEKIDPKGASIFLPQLKRFKNYVLTNLEKARTSQARVELLYQEFLCPIMEWDGVLTCKGMTFLLESKHKMTEDHLKKIVKRLTEFQEKVNVNEKKCAQIQTVGVIHA
ncbi:10314_t:CDS:2, partial [Paraglomus brasilianum]